MDSEAELIDIPNVPARKAAGIPLSLEYLKQYCVDATTKTGLPMALTLSPAAEKIFMDAALQAREYEWNPLSWDEGDTALSRTPRNPIRADRVSEDSSLIPRVQSEDRAKKRVGVLNFVNSARTLVQGPIDLPVRLEHYANAQLDDSRTVNGTTWYVVKIENDTTVWWGKSYSGKGEVCCPPLPPQDPNYSKPKKRSTASEDYAKYRQYSGPVSFVHDEVFTERDDTTDAMQYAIEHSGGRGHLKWDALKFRIPPEHWYLCDYLQFDGRVLDGIQCLANLADVIGPVVNNPRYITQLNVKFSCRRSPLLSSPSRVGYDCTVRSQKGGEGWVSWGVPTVREWSHKLEALLNRSHSILTRSR